VSDDGADGTDGSNEAAPDPPGNSVAKDLTDGRLPGHWQTRYDDGAARLRIRTEFWYLICVLLLALVLLFLTWTHLAQWLRVPQTKTRDFQTYAVALLGGTLGGATFSLKWLYHSVSKNSWNQDRWIWRYTTPLISAAFSLVLVGLVRSHLLRIIDPTALSGLAGVMAFSFLTGYFSDNVIGAMLRLAEHLFGTVRSTDDHGLSSPGNRKDS
jgi:hypothetical protein